MTAIGGRPKPELCFLLGQLRWTLLPRERYGNSLSGRGSNTQTFKRRTLYHWAIAAICRGQHCCWTCKCEKNDYYGYGCAFTLNSSKQFWARQSYGRSQARQNRGNSRRGDWDDRSP